MKKISTLLASILVLSTAASLLFLTGCSKKEEVTVVDEKDELQQELLALKQELAELKAEKETSVATNDGPPAPPVEAHYDDLTDLPDPEIKTWIEQLGSLEVFKKTEGDFNPYEPTTRGEFVTWLYKAYNKMHPEHQIRLAPQAKQYFSDLPPEHPAYKYAQALMEAGYSVGYVNGTFQPDKPITREEMLGIKVPVDLGGAAPSFMWGNFGPKYSDKSDLHKTDHINAIQADFGYRKGYYQGGPHGNNVERAFGNIKTFKRKEPVLRYQAAGAVWQTDTKGEHTAAKALGDGST